EQQQIIRHLQVMSAGVDARSEEADRLQAPRLRGVENRHPVAEHVADVNMAAVDHHLYAVRAAALIGVREVPDAPPDALRRNGRVRGGAGRRGYASQRTQAEQTLQVRAASHLGHAASLGRSGRAEGFALAARATELCGDA